VKAVAVMATFCAFWVVLLPWAWHGRPRGRTEWVAYLAITALATALAYTAATIH
jgi:hypothetical protein